MLQLIFVILAVPNYSMPQETQIASKQNDISGKILPPEGDVDLRWSLTWDRNIALAIFYMEDNGRIEDNRAEEANAVEVAQNFNGKYATRDDAYNGKRFVLRNGTIMPNGVVKVGGLIVQSGKKGEEVQLKTCLVAETPSKYIQGSTSFITTSQLTTIIGIKDFIYGLSTDNDLVLIKVGGDDILVLQDSNGKHAISNNMTADDLANGNYTLAAGTKMPDGRIKIRGKVVDQKIKNKLALKSPQVIKSTPLPLFKLTLKGQNEVRIKNPNDFEVTVGLRSGKHGKDFEVPANGISSVFIPNGKYEIYFVYSNKPDALFKGDDFSLNNNGVEIQIVKVVGGNYGIRQVK